MENLLHILHEDYRVLTGIIEQKLLEVGGTSRQNDFVAFQHFIFARQSNVDKVFRSQQFRKSVLQVRLVAVPANAELLRRRYHDYEFHNGFTRSESCVNVEK